MASIQGVYLALFGRPADPLGLAFFNQATNNGANLTAIGDLSASAEYQARFAGQSNTQIITSIYRSLFNRDPDLAGLTFFATALANKTLTINNIAIAIFDGAQGSDVTIRDLKVSAANAFTAQIDTVAEINGYQGTAAAQSGAAFIATVTTTAPTAEQVASAVAAATVNNGTPGNTVALTTAADVLTGTNNNDTFNGLIGTGATLSAADSINGGAGTDTLNITYANAGGAVADGTAGALLSSIEAINVRNTNATGGNGVTINATGLTGISASGAGDVAFTNVASGVALTANSTTGGALSAAYVAAATAGAISLNSATTNAITLTGAGLTSATISTTGSASTTGAIDVAAAKTVTINAASNLTAASIATTGTTATLNVGGAAASVNVGTLDTDFTTVDASKLTAGGLTATLSGTATVKVTGGAGNDVITTGGVLTTGSVDAGAGAADRLVVAATADLATAALGAKYTGFEVLQVANAQSANLDNIAGITSLRTAGDATFTNVSAAQAGAITVTASGALDIGVKGATGPGQIDTVALTVDDGAAAVATIALGTPTLTGVEKLSINAVDNVTVTALTGAASVDTLTLTGSGTQSITTGAITAANFAVNGSAATGALTVTAAAATVGVSITGGTGNDALTGSNQADILVGGAGDDSLTGGQGLDTLTGGAGKNTFVFANNSTGTPSATAFDTITDFRAGTGNVIDFGATAISVTAGGSGAAGQASVGANGVATLNAADNTLALQLTAVASAVAASGGASVAGESVIWQNGSDAYLFISDATDGLSATDVLVKLTGVTVGAGGLTITGGDITAIA